ncbi:MAG: hypothetical protein WBJ15_04630 [Limnochordia bacterium]
MLETRKTFLLCVSVILLLLFGISGPSTASAQTRAEVAMSLHEAAWLNAAEQAEDDPAWKYAVYQSRTIAVKHPEIYMQADALFNELLTTAPNMGSYYRNRTQELFSQVAEYDKIAREGGENFRWSSFSIEDHKAVGYKEIYHTDAFLPFVDIRLHFMGSALKATSWKATPLSMAEFLYFQNGANDDSFLIVTEDGTAYLYLPGGFLSREKLLRYDGEETESIEGKVVLIFNEECVWYPLMDRDDRDKNRHLAKLVETLTGDDPFPTLTPTEKRIVEKLKDNTGFVSKTDELFALFYAAKMHLTAWDFYRDIMTELYPRHTTEYGFQRHGPSLIAYRNAHVAWLSSLVSPIAAELAAIARDNIDSRSLDGIVTPVFREYMKRVETQPQRTGLELWYPGEFLSLNIDDSILTKAGGCLDAAVWSAAVIDLAQIPDVEIFLVGMKYEKNGGGHAYTAVFRGEEYGTVENGEWAPNFNGLYDLGYYTRDGMVIGALTIRDGWVNFTNEVDVQMREIATSFDAEQVLEILKIIEAKTRGQAKICMEHHPDKAILTESISTFIENFPRMEIMRYEF